MSGNDRDDATRLWSGRLWSAKLQAASIENSEDGKLFQYDAVVHRRRFM